MEYIDQRFEGTTVQLDGNTFRNCVFLDVVFQYSGGPVEIADCSMNRFSFQFGGDLARGLYALHQLFGTDNMLHILRGFTDPRPGNVMIEPV